MKTVGELREDETMGLNAKDVRKRDVYDCPAGAFMVIGLPLPRLRIVWLVDGAERDVPPDSLGNCVLRKRA